MSFEYAPSFACKFRAQSLKKSFPARVFLMNIIPVLKIPRIAYLAPNSQSIVGLKLSLLIITSAPRISSHPSTSPLSHLKYGAASRSHTTSTSDKITSNPASSTARNSFTINAQNFFQLSLA